MRQPPKRGSGCLPVQLRGNQSAVAERKSTLSDYHRDCRGFVRFRARPPRRPEVHHRGHDLSAVQAERRVVLRRVQREERTVPSQLRSNELVTCWSRLERGDGVCISFNENLSHVRVYFNNEILSVVLLN